MLSGSVMPPSTDTPHGLGGHLPLAVSGEKSIAVCLQKLTQLSVNINAMSLKKSSSVICISGKSRLLSFYLSARSSHKTMHTPLFRLSFRSQSEAVSLAGEHTLGCTVPLCAFAPQP